MKRTHVEDLAFDTESKISGWVEKVRDTRYMVFVVFKDITGRIQISIDKGQQPALAEEIIKAIPGSVVSFTGKLVKNDAVKLGGKEFLPSELKLESIAEPSPIDAESNLDKRLNYRWIDLRDDKKMMVFQIATDVEMAMREYCTKNKFIEIHTPKISGQSSEGGSEVFKLEYFGQPACLTQSPQLYKQMAMAAGFEKVFEFGDCFRAEQSFTSRHATEFTSFDIEMSYVDSHHDVMDMEEDILKYTLTQIKKTWGDKIKEVFDVEVKIPEKFPRIPYKDAVEILKTKYNYVGAKNDFDTESERLICDYAIKTYDSEFVFITDFPFNQRAFYSMKSDDYATSGTCKSYDLLWKDVEITSGAQREHRPDALTQNIIDKGMKAESLKDYIEFFKFGCPPHGGYAIGTARLLAKLLNLSSIKESTYLFRGPNRLIP